MTAVEIHAHPSLKLGRRPPEKRPALRLGQFLTGQAPAHPAAADHFHKLRFGLYRNDQFGVCGPTSVANLVRLITGGLLGRETAPTQAAVFDLYRRSGNPNFDPATGKDDNGVEMQKMLEALLADGIGGLKPVCFAKANVRSDQELDAAVSIFGGCLWGVDLEHAQQAQTNARRWTYQPSSRWGGHAVLNGKYAEPSGVADVISWKLDIVTTGSFRQHQLQEAWVVVWPWNLDHPAFQTGVDVPALEAAYKALTGRPLA